MFKICPTNQTLNLLQLTQILQSVPTRNQREIIFFPPLPAPRLEPGWSQARAGDWRRLEFNYIEPVEVRGKLSSASWLILIIIYPPPPPPPSPNPTLQHFHKDTHSHTHWDRIQAIVASPTWPRQNILISGRKSIWDLEEMIILDLKYYRLIIKLASLRDFISANQVRTNQLRSFQLVKLLFTLSRPRV